MGITTVKPQLTNNALDFLRKLHWALDKAQIEDIDHYMDIFDSKGILTTHEPPWRYKTIQSPF